jgi:glycosyltransferase involved in cell wall biosynthesis
LDAQDVIRKVEAELEKPRARDYLVHTGWGNHTIELIMTYAAYKQGVKHQKNPELLAACLESFHARRSGAGARGDLSSPVRKSLRISIVTPSYKQIDYLKNCAASVADQAGDFKVEHLIQDGESGPEFEQWAAQQGTAVCVSEKDDGMYDAINRGFRKATGDIIAWLNCDEQYLPGTLQRVADFFNANPDIDILFGDVVLVDEKMTPLAYRMAIKPDSLHIRNAHLSTFSAATFVRRRVLEDGHFLQSRWKTIADAVWIEELLEAGYQAAVMNEPMAVFCMLGSNLGQSETHFHERKNWEIERGQISWWNRKLIIINHRLKKLLKGAYYVRNAPISVFTEGSNYRTTMTGTLSGRWNYAISQSEARRNERDGKIKTLA